MKWTTHWILYGVGLAMVIVAGEQLDLVVIPSISGIISFITALGDGMVWLVSNHGFELFWGGVYLLGTSIMIVLSVISYREWLSKDGEEQ